ncbi:hypothetical protein PCANC_02416 [Puccinia coronata f. sp. avenae]|uniref:Large ribosomal subunit protein mL59 domain-containing protein n=1 Tax=Puccinia coronata f. sp. avenae TaxID=200324 RepID=A0A2N5W4Z6_9BASI|nr:hypothetical protein PCANC_02416 [Puccinia coronata f. sp. avenae]
MLTTTAPTMRTANASRVLKQSNQFISPHSVLLRTKTAVLQRAKKVRTVRPRGSPSLATLLSTYGTSGQQDKKPSPFLPTKFRSGHSSPLIHPDKVRWRAPLFKAQARALLCKQAFHWRILRHIFNLTPDAFQKKHTLPRSAQNLLKQQPNFYDGSLSIDEYRKILHDPVPKLIALFGGQDRLTIKDKRLLGLFQPPKDVAKRTALSSPPHPAAVPPQEQEQQQLDNAHDPIRVPPRYAPPTLVPHAFGPYVGRRKPFKGKIRERNRDAKVAQVTQKMVKMDDRIQAYRNEWKIVKEKSKPALPF